MQVHETTVFGFRPALRAMRNPMDSWAKSDSRYGVQYPDEDQPWDRAIIVPESPYVGSEDMKLALSLTRAGSSHRKFLRQIGIWVEITLPRYVWTEVDTYKLGTVRNSCSTMHRLGTRNLIGCDFEGGMYVETLAHLNVLVANFRAQTDPEQKAEALRFLKNHLPEGYLQRATLSLNYETALNMYGQRQHHRLREWHRICDWIHGLPYMSQLLEAVL